jgi:hypothetical protein
MGYPYVWAFFFLVVEGHSWEIVRDFYCHVQAVLSTITPVLRPVEVTKIALYPRCHILLGDQTYLAGNI